MKKALLIILAITLLFTACNADATSGLFRTISEAREAISIKYEQILGIKDSKLYFRTQEGIFEATSASSKTLIIGNKANNQIQSAALIGDTILYTAEDTTNTSKPPTLFAYNLATTVSSSVTITDGYSLLRLMQNGQALLTKDGTLNEYHRGTCSATAIDADVSPINTTDLTGHHGLEDIFIPSDYKDTSGNEFVISFVKKDGSSYKSFYVSSSAADKISSTIKNIASVSFVSSHVFVLTTDGKLYHLANTESEAPTELISTDLKFDRNDFFYPIKHGTNLHFITNPKNTDSMTVFTVDMSSSPISAGTSSTTSIKSGYAAALKDTKIVSSLDLGSNKFLVATEKHGMYSVTVDPAHVNEDSGNNIVTMSKAEDYTF